MSRRASNNTALLSIGKLLRARRDAQQLTMIQVVEFTGISQSKLSKIENGLIPVKASDIALIGDALRLNELDRTRLNRLLAAVDLPATSLARIHLSGVDRQQVAVAEDEARTSVIRHYSNVLVPGLLQTVEYSRAVFADLGVRGTRLEDAIVNRQARQRVLASRGRTFNFVISESVLHTRPGGLEDLHLEEQLSFLALCAARPNVHLDVIPTRRGTLPSAAHGFTIYDQRLVTAETIEENHRLTEPTDVHRYEVIFDELREMAIGGTSAISLVDEVISWLESIGSPREAASSTAPP